MDVQDVIARSASVELPPAVQAVPTMLLRTEQQLLHALARDHYRNEGYIVDAGAFLGGSTVALGSGLLQNPRFRAAPREKILVSYDLFELWGTAAVAYFPAGTDAGFDFSDLFRKNTSFLGAVLDIRVGDITKAEPPPAAVEILFIDVAKSVAVNDAVIQLFFPLLIPGRSVVIQQDYLWSGWNGWIHVTMEHFSDHFTMIGHTEQNSVAFLCTQEIPREGIRDRLVGSMSHAQIMSLQDRAIARFKGEKQLALLAKSRENLRTLLSQGLV